MNTQMIKMGRHLRVPTKIRGEVEQAGQRRGAILMRHWKCFERYQLKVSEIKGDFGVGFLWAL